MNDHVSRVFTTAADVAVAVKTAAVTVAVLASRTELYLRGRATVFDVAHHCANTTKDHK